MVSTFRKTAIKFHYEFNVRHLANMFQGILMAQRDVIKEPWRLVKLWVHEAERTYGDLLLEQSDLDAYQKIACQIIGSEDRQKVAGKTFIKKSGCVLAMRMFARKLSPRAACSDVFCASSWRKLAMAFEISFEIRQCEIQYNDHGCEKLAA